MDHEGSIEHDGVVLKSDNQSVTVEIDSVSACSGCHAGNRCTLSQTGNRKVDINGVYNVNPGDKVTVVMRKTMGYSAVILGYILPLLVLVVMLILFTSLKMPEMVAGGLSVGTLAPYYLVLYILRRKINSKYTFTIKA